MLQIGDLWKMDASRQSHRLANKLNDAWRIRLEKADEFNSRLDNGTIKPGVIRRGWWRLRTRGNNEAQVHLLEQWLKASRKTPSLVFSLNEVFGWDFWVGGAVIC